MTLAHEVNFDGLIGPTHNHAALSWGNRASMGSLSEASHPRAAALQGLEKMRRLKDLGVHQGVLPPLTRPYLDPLRRYGLVGAEADILVRAAEEAPELLAACFSASAMWAANSAAMTPSMDSGDGKVHFTAANLISKLHRSLEADQTSASLRAIFRDPAHFRHHGPLPRADRYADEGAANHTRFCLDHGGPGLHLFVYGRDAVSAGPTPKRFPARQTRQACEAICRRHGLDEDQVVLAQQNPAAIDAGVFHNDVIATGSRDLFFYHEQAYLDTPGTIRQLNEAFVSLTGQPLRLLEVSARELSLDLCVRSYLFNSQVVTTCSGRTVLLAPVECARVPEVRDYLSRVLADRASPIDAVEFVDVTQSMRGGGGPACLRLRVTLTEEQLRSLHGNVLLTDTLYEHLRETVCRTYPEEVTFADLSDPAFVKKCQAATARVYAILGLV